MLVSYIKRGASATFFYSLSSFLSRGISFMFLPFFLSKLTLAEFGIWDFYQVFFATGTLVLSSCAATSMFRFYFLYKDDESKQKQAMGNSFLSIAIISGVVFLFANALNYFSYLNCYAYLTLMNVALFSLFSLVLSYLRVKEWLLLYVCIICGQNFLALFGTIVGVWLGYGIQSFFYANFLSYCICLPSFFYLFFQYRTYCVSVFKKQLLYSTPLLLYSFMYTCFFSIDKFFIKNYSGYELLGSYGLLWRFGSIFQMAAIAMIDAWGIVVFNAQKEENGNYLISKLITYYAVALTTTSLFAIIISCLGVSLFFPHKYHYLVYYLPLFFVPLLFIEIARLFQVACGLTTKTYYIPIISSLVVILQALFLYFLACYGIYGVFLANAAGFSIYIILAYCVSSSIYTYQLINKAKTQKLLLCFIVYVCLLHSLLQLVVNANYYLVALGASWPLLLWYNGIIDEQEKEWIKIKITVYNSLARSKLFFLKIVNKKGLK